jgi:hypothetical protein
VENNIDEIPPAAQTILEAREIVQQLKIPIGMYDPENPFKFIEENRGEAPEPIEHLESIPINEISAAMNQYTNWSSYVSTRLTEYKGYRDCLDKELKDLMNTQLATEGGKVTQKRASAKTSHEYRQKEYTYIVMKLVCEMLTTALDNSNRTYACLSRHITALQSDIDRENRDNNHTKKTNSASFNTALKTTTTGVRAR